MNNFSNKKVDYQKGDLVVITKTGHSYSHILEKGLSKKIGFAYSDTVGKQFIIIDIQKINHNTEYKYIGTVDGKYVAFNYKGLRLVKRSPYYQKNSVKKELYKIY